MLSFQLLGPVSLHKDRQPLSQFRSQKEVALLIYLAQTGQSHTRESLADLLWEDRSSRQARSNLRTVLTRLRKHVGDEVEITRKAIAQVPGSHWDVDALLLLQTITLIGQIDATNVTSLQRALSLYRGEFLADFSLPDAPRFEQWMVTTRQQIHREVLTTYAKLGEYTAATGAPDDGIALAKRWLQVDALDEAAHTLLIQLLLQDGQTQAARIHYEHYVKLLSEALGVAPSAAMTALIETARSTHAVAPAPATTLPTAVHSFAHEGGAAKKALERPQHNIPAPHDQFFGRERIQQDIVARLAQPWCRLVTIVGQGGVGKTRLATTVARSCVNQYGDGVWLIELAGIDSEDDDPTEAIAVEIATVLDLRLAGSTKPVEQLFNHLEHKAMLLVLDNVEHLLEGGVSLIVDLLARCEQIQLIVTSREALHIRAEWVVPLIGLDYLVAEHDVTYSDAVALFAARAAQTQRGALCQDELAIAQQICHLVEGLPLAIELAAALSDKRSLQSIADELNHGFDALVTTLHDVPQRHRNLQIVFDMSWQMLPTPLQRQLAALAIFRGGFTADAAQQVADATQADLAQLAEKSLLTLDSTTERYTLHPIVRAFAAAKSTAPDATVQSHADYYFRQLAEAREPLQGATPQHAVATLMPDLENVRLAWQTALALRWADGLVRALPSLSIVYQLRGLSHQAETTMHATLHVAVAWGATGVILAAHAGLERARFQNRLGRYRAAMETVEMALRHARQCQARWAEGMGHVLWGESLWRLGEYTEAQEKLNHALTVADIIGDARESTLLIGWSHHHLGVIDDIQGRYNDAASHLEQACAAWRIIHRAQALGSSLNSIGLVYYNKGDIQAAQQAMEQALVICNHMDNRYLQSLLLNNLSMIATEQQDFRRAHHYLQLGLALAVDNGDMSAQSYVHTNLGKNYRLLGKTELSVESLEIGVQLSESIGNRALLATGLFYLAETKRNQKDAEQVDALYEQALKITQQDNLQHLACEILVGRAEFLSKRNESEAKNYSEQAVILAKTVQNQDMLERATAINAYLNMSPI